MDEIVRLQTLDGTWEVGGRDRRRGIWVEDLSCSWDDWGPKTASFVMKRESGMPMPDVSGFTPIEIERGAGIWEGFIDQTPASGENSLSVEALGWQDHADDDVLQKMYVHSRLTDWRDQRSFLGAGLTSFQAAPMVEVGDGGIVIGHAKNTQSDVNVCVGATVDLGPDPSCWFRRVVVDTETINGNASYTFRVSGHSIDSAIGGGTNEAIINVVGTNNLTNTQRAGNATPASGWRYCTIFLTRSDALSGVTANDILVRIKAVRLFSSTGFDTGSAPFTSILKASDVLNGVLPLLCPLWSQDLTGIDTTSFSLPEFAPTQQRTFREYVEALNSLHGYVRKLERGRRFRFKPQPTVPLLQAAKVPGVKYLDASKNATREIYNRALAVGNGPDGEQLTIERFASQQPSVVPDKIASPAFPNPSADVDLTGWGHSSGGLTRDTVIFDTTPASIKSNPSDDILSTTLTGTMSRGVLYFLRGRMRVTLATSTVVELRASGVSLVLKLIPLAAATWTSFEVPVLLKTNTPTPEVQFYTDLTTSLNVDTLEIWSAQPTLVDRRRFIRTKSVSMPSQGVSTLVLQQLADIWLQTHMSTPARGNLEVQGRTLTNFTSGDSIHPFEVGEYTGELVCLSEEIDPDTGALGRYVPIASVNYEGNTETASIALDSTRDNFEKLVARYDVISSGGGPG